MEILVHKIEFQPVCIFLCFFFFFFLLNGIQRCLAIPRRRRQWQPSTLAWKIPWAEHPGRLQSMVSQESDTTEWLHLHFSLSCTGEGNGNPLQCSCRESPRDGGAWWAAVYGVAQSRHDLAAAAAAAAIPRNCSVNHRAPEGRLY